MLVSQKRILPRLIQRDKDTGNMRDMVSNNCCPGAKKVEEINMERNNV